MAEDMNNSKSEHFNNWKRQNELWNPFDESEEDDDLNEPFDDKHQDED